MKLLYGKPLRESLIQDIEYKLNILRKNKKSPRLALIRVGNKHSDIAYEKSIKNILSLLDIEYDLREFEEDVTIDELKSEIEMFNDDNTIESIMIFRPLPERLREVTEYILPTKDIDCSTLYNQGKFFTHDEKLYYPSTPLAVIEMLKYYNIDLESKNVVVLGTSQVVGKPLSLMLMNKKATVTVCNSKTNNLISITKSADIVITAIGKPKFLTKEYFTDNQVIIDVGINFDENDKMCGDVDFENINFENIQITPVPKGIGVVTTLILIKQLVEKSLKLS